MVSICEDPGVVSLLQILSFNDWIKILACLDKDKVEGLKMIRDFSSQIPILTKALQSDLTKFTAAGAELCNHFRKLCGLDPMFLSSPSTPAIPPSGNIFNRDIYKSGCGKVL